MHNPDKIIKWGIIGCGNVTEVKSGPAFNKVPQSKLVAVMRRNAAKAEDYATRHSVPKWYDDAQKLIDDPEVNAIYIATPPAFHEEYTLAAFKAGKPVYVEKPMTLDAMGAQRMMKASTDYRQKLSVAHYRRQQPLFLKVRELLNDKVIGETRFVNLKLYQAPDNNIIARSEENWRLTPELSGGGLFHDLAPHQLDLMHYFFGDAIYARGFAINQASLYNADDLVTGHICFENQVVFNGIWCYSNAASESTDHCEIVGSKGSIRFAVFEHKRIELRVGEQLSVIDFEPLQHVQQPMIQAVVEYFLDQRDNPCSVADGLQVMQWIDSFTSKPGASLLSASE